MNAALSATLVAMRAELESQRLEIGLVPAPEPKHSMHCVRRVFSRNADWYRRFCARFPSTRRRRNPRPDTSIRRRETIRAIERLLNGEQAGPVYGPRLMDAARAYYRSNRARITEELAAA